MTGSGSDAARPAPGTGDPPAPEPPVVPAPRPELLAPLLESAGEELLALDADDVPLALRALRTFDRRGLSKGPAVQQLLRALESAPGFADAAVARFAARDDVVAELDTWAADDAAARADAAAARGDLPLLASVLWALHPPGWEHGLGAVAGVAVAERRRRGADTELDGLARRVDVLDEARRRAEAARMEAEARAEVIAAELRDERGARRAALAASEAEAAAAQARVVEHEEAVAHARAAVEAERARAEREAARARSLEGDIARVRRELADAATSLPPAVSGAPSGLDPADARVLADAGDAARRLADALVALLGRVAPERAVAGAAPVRVPDPSAAAPPERAPTRRPSPLPRGLVADTPDGASAMLRTPGVLLVVDGYNVAKRAWGHVPTPAELRERLAVLLAQLHGSSGCEIVVVFDGDGSVALPPLRRPGLRVLFSAADEEADDVVVRLVGDRPRRAPVVVASSDAWVREHAAREGAEVVGADTLVAVLRPTRPGG